MNTTTPAFNRIVVATDFSTGSRFAVDYAVALAQRLGAAVHVVHVVEDPSVAGMFTEAYIDMALLRKERRCDARHRMNGLLGQLHATRITDEIASGPVAHTIVEIAADRGAGLIVMGTHGRTGLAHVLVGSVAEQVMRTAACPVLTVREGLSGALAHAPRAEAGRAERVMAGGPVLPASMRNPAHPDRICWGCDRLCPANDLGCSNGSIRTPHPKELFGDDWEEWFARDERPRDPDIESPA